MNKTEKSGPGPQSMGSPFDPPRPTPKLQRIFLLCGDATSNAIRALFDGEGEFVTCGEGTRGIESIHLLAGHPPGLVIIELENFSIHDLEIAGALKLEMPEVPLFLVTEQCSLQSEKQAISHGIDAVFETKYELSSLVLNAREVLSYA